MLKGSLSDLLRHQTRAAHQSVDSHPALAVLTSPDITLEQYGYSLGSMYQAWLPLESAVESALQRPGELPADPRFKDILLFSLKNYFPRRYALQEDLKALGLTPAAREPEDPVRFPTPVALVGGLYVYFGARMGSRLIATKLTASLPEAPTGFFGGTKDQWPGFWQSFKTLMDVLDLPPRERASMVGSANETFEWFRRALG